MLNEKEKEMEKKHIILAGVPRSGKTTLSAKLAETLEYQHLAMDAILMSFDKVFPEMGILHTDCWDFTETSTKFIPFVKRMTEAQFDYKVASCDYKMVLDLYHITPKDFSENIDRNLCDIYFLGYPNISVEEKFQQIRKFDTESDWTSQSADDVVLEHITKYIEISKWLERECEKYDLPFVDVSWNREKILKETAGKILGGKI